MSSYHVEGGEFLGVQTLGVVDVGSNTVHLLVARTDGHTITPLVDVSEGLQLGSAVDYEGEIGPDKLDELVATLSRFKAASEQAGAARPRLLATQAIRAAANREAVCAKVLAATGLKIKVLRPDQEAEMSFIGAYSFCPGIGPMAALDIGGGSMQAVVGRDGSVWDSVSLPLGATRLSNLFLPSDPPTRTEEALLTSYLSRVIPPALPLRDTDLTDLVGVGGTLRRVPGLLGLAPGDSIPRGAIEELLSLVRGKSADELALNYGLKPERSRIILPALLTLREVARAYNWPPLTISGYGVREGAILWLARGGKLTGEMVAA